jgi:hypothetical protein
VGSILGTFAGLTHWTREGTFAIVPTILAASRFYELRFGEKLLGTYAYITTAAESISAGDHDQALGISGASLRVPSNVADWNGFR